MSEIIIIEVNHNRMKCIQNIFNSKELYHILFENSRDAVSFTEKSQSIDCNESAVIMFGFTSNELKYTSSGTPISFRA